MSDDARWDGERKREIVQGREFESHGLGYVMKKVTFALFCAHTREQLATGIKQSVIDKTRHEYVYITV